MNKQIELAQKLKRLAEGGIGGERYNAQRQLERLMAKHNISETELQSELLDWRKFTIRKADKLLFMQVLTSVIGNRAINSKRHKKHPTWQYFECTEFERLEVEAKFAIYKNAYKQDLEVFFTAFIMKHYLYNSEGVKGDAADLTLNQRIKLFRALEMKSGLSDVTYRKELPKKV